MEKFEKDIKDAVRKELENKNSEQLRNALKRKIDGLENVNNKLNIKKLTKKLYNENPRLNNPTFEFENNPEYLELMKPIQNKDMDINIANLKELKLTFEYEISEVKKMIREKGKKK